MDSSLTARARIPQLIADGLTKPEIAAQTGVSRQRIDQLTREMNLTAAPCHGRPRMPDQLGQRVGMTLNGRTIVAVLGSQSVSVLCRKCVSRYTTGWYSFKNFRCSCYRRSGVTTDVVAGKTFGSWFVLSDPDAPNSRRVCTARCGGCEVVQSVRVSNIVYGLSKQCRSCAAAFNGQRLAALQKSRRKELLAESV